MEVRICQDCVTTAYAIQGRVRLDDPGTCFGRIPFRKFPRFTCYVNPDFNPAFPARLDACSTVYAKCSDGTQARFILAHDSLRRTFMLPSKEIPGSVFVWSDKPVFQFWKAQAQAQLSLPACVDQWLKASSVCGLSCCRAGQSVDLTTVAKASAERLTSCVQVQTLAALIATDPARTWTAQDVRQKMRRCRKSSIRCALNLIKLAHQRARFTCFTSREAVCPCCDEFLDPRLSVVLECGHAFHADATCSLGEIMSETQMRCPQCPASQDNLWGETATRKRASAMDDADNTDNTDNESYAAHTLALLLSSPVTSRKRRKSLRVETQEGKRARQVDPDKFFRALMTVVSREINPQD